MKKMIAPSILSADFGCLREEIARLEEAGADLIHIDVMDGRFVPNITMGPFIVETIKKLTNLPLDVHLMIEEPIRYVDDFVKAGADWISVHVEGERHLERVLSRIKKLGSKAGVAYNPATPVSGVEYILHVLDYILVMTVNPGFGGQKLIPSALDKVELLKKEYDLEDRGILVEVDGGVKVDNVDLVARKGTDIFVAGSGIFGYDDYGEVIRKMRSIIDET